MCDICIYVYIIRDELFAANEDIFAVSKYTAKPRNFINKPKYRF